MAITFSFTDKSDDDQVYGSAWARMQQCTLADVDKVAMISYFIYKTQAKGNRRVGVLARKDYQIVDPIYSQYFAKQPIRVTYNGSVEAACDALALATLDTNGKSFFDGGVIG